MLQKKYNYLKHNILFFFNVFMYKYLFLVNRLLAEMWQIVW